MPVLRISENICMESFCLITWELYKLYPDVQFIPNFDVQFFFSMGRFSSVGIAIRYGLDGAGSDFPIGRAILVEDLGPVSC
jgi:hypothetical protein